MLIESMQKIHQETERPENNIYRQVEVTIFSFSFSCTLCAYVPPPFTHSLIHSNACFFSSKLPHLLTYSPRLVILILICSFLLFLPPFQSPSLSLHLSCCLCFFCPRPSSFHSMCMCSPPIPLIGLILRFTHNHHQSPQTYVHTRCFL